MLHMRRCEIEATSRRAERIPNGTEIGETGAVSPTQNLAVESASRVVSMKFCSLHDLHDLPFTRLSQGSMLTKTTTGAALLSYIPFPSPLSVVSRLLRFYQPLSGRCSSDGGASARWLSCWRLAGRCVVGGLRCPNEVRSLFFSLPGQKRLRSQETLRYCYQHNSLLPPTCDGSLAHHVGPNEPLPHRASHYARGRIP